VRKNIGDMRGTLPAGVIGPVSTTTSAAPSASSMPSPPTASASANCATHVEAARSRLLHVPDVSKSRCSARRTSRSTSNSRPSGWPACASNYPTILATLQAQNLVRPAGTIQTEQERVFLRVTGSFDSERDIESVNIVAGDRIFRLGDIATVRRGFSDPPQPMFRVNGQPAIGLAIAMRDAGDILALGENVRK
jgi:multidrug efflux pump subunit AcrB